ncbi:putative NRPS-like protein biosynthetic cluster [Pestalotiopsis sp. 9143b]|nr:putative NRPS-like protein biosynthetic cluster [Pestalotiopsis sp. 9143b]
MLSDLSSIIDKLNVDACELTPSVAGSLLKKRHRVPKLKLMLTIGEMLTEPVVQEFGGDAQVPSILWGMYGPTEAAIHCTLQPAFKKSTSPSCIGIPLDTVSAFVIQAPANQADTLPFEIAPIGQVGELAVGGHQLATGYLNRPEQNAASFIETQFGRVYKTGDKARMLSDGTIECLGRVSEGQIKLNGQRMEIGEVEHVIIRTEGCHSVYVCVISNILVAFAAVDRISGMRDQIAANCKQWLPAFMIPSEIVVMESFPRLPSGKIDRMSLKKNFSSSHIDQAMTSDNQQFKDALEQLLCVSVGDMLQASVRPLTRLSSVGVDSIFAIQLAAQLRASGLPVSPLDVLGSKTLVDLHRILKKRQSEPDQSRMVTNGHHEISNGDLKALVAEEESIFSGD